MADQTPPQTVEPGDLDHALDPRFVTPFHRTFDINARLEAVRLYGTVAVLGPKPTFYNSDDTPDGPADDDDHEYEVDPWGRPRQTMARWEDPFIDRDLTRDEADEGRATDVGELPRFGNFGPYFRKVTATNELAGKHVAPKHIGGRYDITMFIDEELRKDPFELNRDFDDWRTEVEFQFGPRPPMPPPSMGPAPNPGEATYDFSSLSIIYKNGQIRPLLVPHPNIRSPLAPQRGTDEEKDADYERINALSRELSTSWWVANILWFMGENDASLIKTMGMVEEGSCPAEVFPFDLDPNNIEKLDDYENEMAALHLYNPLPIVDGRPDPIENSFWVPKLKGVNGSAVRFMRPPFPEASTLDTRYLPVPALQSTVLPERIELRRSETKLWDGIPGHTFRLPPYFWPDELKDSHLSGDDRPFAVDIRRIPVIPKLGSTQPRPPNTFRPTRRLNIAYRDRVKVPQNKKRTYIPAVHSPGLKSKQSHGSSQLGGNVDDGDSPADSRADSSADSPDDSFLQDEFEYDMVGDIWGQVGGFEGRDYDSERQMDHDRWYRYFLINNDSWERSIIVNGVQVKPGAVAGPLPAFAMFELGDQAAFWFGVGGRDHDPNTMSTPEKRAAENEAPGSGNRAKVARTFSFGFPGQATRGAPTQPGGQNITAATSGLGNLQLGQTQSQPVKQVQFKGDAPEFVPSELGGLERLGLRGGAGAEADLDPADNGGGAATPVAKQAAPANESTPRMEEAMEEVARQKAYAAAGELLGGGTPQQKNTGTMQNTTTGTPPNTSTGTPQNVDAGTTNPMGLVTPYHFSAVTLQPTTTESPQYMITETEPYMSTGALESRLERLGICVDPSWDRETLLDELVKTVVAQAERKAQARAERMIATLLENSELEQRHICESLGIIINPGWNSARIRGEIVRLYETAYQELMSNNNAAAEYEEAMGTPANDSEHTGVTAVVNILFWLASRYMYRQRSGVELKALCEKYRIDAHHTWDSERVIIEILRAVAWKRRIGMALAATQEASIAASIAAIAAMDAETATIRAAMANGAKAKAGPIVIDLTKSNTPTVIDLADSPTQAMPKIFLSGDGGEMRVGFFEYITQHIARGR